VPGSYGKVSRFQRCSSRSSSHRTVVGVRALRGGVVHGYRSQALFDPTVTCAIGIDQGGEWMRRSVVITTFILALAVAPALVFAQTPPAAQPPAGQQPPAAAAPAAPKEPRLALAGATGIFTFVIKPDQTASFEELMGKVKDALGKSENPVRKQQLAGWKFFKATEMQGTNAIYVLVLDPAVPAAEYDPLVVLSESLGATAGTPENQELLKKYAAVFAGLSRLNLTPIGR
jgi:hypothetical protein